LYGDEKLTTRKPFFPKIEYPKTLHDEYLAGQCRAVGSVGCPIKPQLIMFWNLPKIAKHCFIIKPPHATIGRYEFTTFLNMVHGGTKDDPQADTHS
jgi:hypothetical protein